jgi:hypothetical protein
MLYRFKRKAETAWFRFTTQNVFNTAPLVCVSGGGAIIVSQVCHRDLAMYLVAVKSFGQYVRPNKVVVLDDTSLTQTDTETLRDHIHTVEIIPITAVNNDKCPKGGCWERLLFISDIVPSSYVIQVDSDTLTVKVPSVIGDHIKRNASFTLGEWRGQNIVYAREAADLVRQEVEAGNAHVQMISESNLHRLVYDHDLKYVRGSAGFAGFAKGSFSRSAVERFSHGMANLIGEKKWSDWGSEQVTSNFIVANSQEAQVLPFPEYCFHSPGTDVESATFVHFIGSHRFHGGRYARLARQVILQLHQA